MDYQNGKIYRLVAEDNSYYIGSTKDELLRRFWNHKACAKKRNSPVYNHFNQFNWDLARIELIENFPCNSKEELLFREGEVILEHKDDPLCLNKNIALKDPVQRKLEKQLRREDWREKNRERDRETVRRYNQKNKEKLNENRGKKRAEKKSQLEV